MSIFLWGSAAIGVVQMLGWYLISKKQRAGWWVTMCSGLTLTAYNVYTGQYGFLPVAAVGFTVNVNALRTWK